MEKRKCNVCQIEKSIESYYRCKNCRDGRLSICKLCKIKGLKVNKDHIIHPFNQMWRMSEERFFHMSRVTKQDYEMMWRFLEAMGYDINQDIHKQLVDKINDQTNKPVKYRKKPVNRQAQWLPNGEKNPNRNKKPPISE